jgi:hypothetical protein
MELFLLVLALLLIAVLAPTFGRDSRSNIDDDAWSRDGLWSRSPQPRV